MDRIEKAASKAEALATTSQLGASARRARLWAGLNRYLVAEERRAEQHTPADPHRLPLRDQPDGSYVVETVDLQQQAAGVVSGRVAHDGIADFLATAFGRVAKAISDAGTAPAGPPFARYQVTGDGFEVQAGFPVGRPVATGLAVEAAELPGGSAARTLHAGSYAEVEKAYRVLQDWVVDNGYVARDLPWESYLDGPDVPVPRTVVYLPYAEPSLPGSGPA